jgi:hypothetical protein
MSKFLADECFPRDSINLLASAGFEIHRFFAGANDAEVLAEAMSTGRVLLTMDVTDFGEILAQRALAPEDYVEGFGVVIFRFRTRDTSLPALNLLQLLSDNTRQLDGYMSSVSDGPIIRQRPL